MNDDLAKEGWAIGDVVTALRKLTGKDGKNKTLEIAKGSAGAVVGMAEGKLVVKFGGNNIRVESSHWVGKEVSQEGEGKGKAAAGGGAAASKPTVPPGCAFLRGDGVENISVFDWPTRRPLNQTEHNISRLVDLVKVACDVCPFLGSASGLTMNDLVLCKRDKEIEVSVFL